MDTRAEVREFLVSRRAKITPAEAGLPDVGPRRVPGLRRGEVAALAEVSVEYYSKLERGALAGASASVLDAIARALKLDEAERAHLFHLAQAADGTSAIVPPRRRSPKRWSPRPSLQWALDAIATGPAIISNGRTDLLAANHLARAMYSVVYGAYPPRASSVGPSIPRSDPRGRPNFARFTFLDSAARQFYPEWDLVADTTVAVLRASAGRDPHDKALHDLVGELSTRSNEFRRLWSAHDVRVYGTGIKRFRHDVVGDLTLTYETMDMVAEPGLSMTIYAAEPGSTAEPALALLASWATGEDIDAAAQQA